MDSSICLYSAALLLLFGGINAAPAEDLITDLPGLATPPTFKQYSGYLNATEGRHYFYWFTEAQNVDPATAPVVFWFNGGPGCSSVNGFLTENGAFRVNPDGQTLSVNDYAWNQLANVIFLESPAGVGFSYADNQAQIPTNDEQTAVDNYAALDSFFQKYPEYLLNPLFITGESYAGIYVPTLTYLILNGTRSYNLQGIAVGNGLHESKSNFNTEITFYGFHGMFDLTVEEDLLTYCCQPTTPVTCDFYDATDVNCIEALITANVAASASGLNPYGIYDYCDRPGATNGKGYSPMNKRFRPLPKAFTKEQREMIQNLGSDPPCSDSDYIRNWINQESVRTALHVPDFVQQWDTCSDIVGATYVTIYDSMAPQYQYILNRVRTLFYNGDTDSVCNFLGGEYFAESLGRNQLEPYHPWIFEGQTAGFMKTFSNLTFLTVLGSGHMVPTDRPAQALHMINNFIYDIPFMVNKN